jgi:hypothetical protein
MLNVHGPQLVFEVDFGSTELVVQRLWILTKKKDGRPIDIDDIDIGFF